MPAVTAPLDTPRLRLRPFRTADLDDLLAIESRPEVARFLYWEPRDRAAVQQVIRDRSTLTRLESDGDVVVLAAERRADRTVIGDVSLTLRSAEHRQAEIGFVFHPAVAGQGYAAEAAGAMLDFAFRTGGVHRVYGQTDPRNTRSAALMRRLGMRQEAHLRENEIFKGEWGDVLVFAVLEDEWR